ncbi:patatin-like phospholipase family protein [Archangium violaceum]|uniref:patatin-like phospholipase family protein n=1 Tax=Archangium violaceum TaxID=83451 RepID=UPI002B318A9E|nr:patatin-like phospholipase family protein [Archangium gephyra]
MPYRILSMDGSSISGGEGYVTAGLLGSLRQTLTSRGHHQPLLNSVDLFAGSSAGAFNAAFLAAEADPDAALSKIIDFWGQVVSMNKKGVSGGRFLLALAGASSILDSNYMRDFFCDYFGSTLRLGDLKHKVAIASYQLDGQRKGMRTWKAKIFHNTSPQNDADMDELVVDVLMRSGSPPLSYPIYQGLRQKGSGYVDGGLFANNPSLVGLAQAINILGLKNKNSTLETMDSEQPDLTDILLFSVGNGQMSSYVAPTFHHGVANWGFAKWLLDAHNPMLLIKMLLEAGGEAVHFQCRMILRKEYFRLNPLVDKRLSASNLNQVESVLQTLLGSQSTMAQLERTLKWVSRSGWLGDTTPRPSPEGA